MRKLTTHNDAWLKACCSDDRGVHVDQPDRTEVHGLIVKPPTFTAGRRYPALLRIHGGPNSQDEHSFNFERELFAANGYVVVAVNYRGSNGRGSAYQRAIFADWGNKEVVDFSAPWTTSRRWASPIRIGSASAAGATAAS